MWKYWCKAIGIKAFDEDDFEASKLNNKLTKAKEEYSSRKLSSSAPFSGRFRSQIGMVYFVNTELGKEFSPVLYISGFALL